MIRDASGSEALTLSRVSYLSPVHRISSGGRPLGSVRLTSPLRNKYAIGICGESWTFRMPTFTVALFGETRHRTDLWILAGPSKMEWNVLVRPGVPPWPLVGVVAYIHNPWWRFG